MRTGLVKAPLSFVANTGALDERVAFWLPGSSASVYLTDAGLTYRLSAPGSSVPRSELDGRELGVGQAPSTRGWVVRQDFVGAAPVWPVAAEAGPTTVSFFKGSPDQWRTSVPTAASVGYTGLWPGVDATYGGTGERLKYEFTVAAGADPGAIRLAYRGAERVTLTPEGELAVQSPAGGFTDAAPTAYQDIDGRRVPVVASYALEAPEADGSQPYRFALGPYDASRPLVIDPATIVYAGFIGGSSFDAGYEIAVDAAGAAYVTGETDSTAATFPVAVGPDVTANGGFTDAFMAKVAPGGAGLVYAGFIGGSGYDEGSGIAVDAAGAAYVTGQTTSTESSFPVAGGPDLTANGGTDAFVAKVAPSGAGLVYAGFIGGSGDDEGRDIAVDAVGAAYVTGLTTSTEATFPVVGGPDLTANGGFDAFVAKVAPGGGGLVYAGFIGGSGGDSGIGVAVDAAGAAYVAGGTTSTESTFSVVGGPDLTANGGSDGFVAKVAPAGTGLVYAGFIGGSGGDGNLGIGVDAAGAAYVTGRTESTGATFPVMGGPDLTANGGFADAFVAKVSPGGAGLVYAGFIGGSGFDAGYGIAVDADGAAYVVGLTDSTEATFPVVGGPDLTANGGLDAFVVKVAPGGAGLVYAGFIGGSGLDDATGIAVDAAGSAYVAGYTEFYEPNESTFPVAGGPDLTANSGADAFVVKVGGGSAFHPLVPTRILDSRPPPNQVGPFNTPWGPGAVRDVTVIGAGVPAGADAVTLNVTVTGTTGAGFLTIWPKGQAQPVASSLNWAPGQTIPNAVTVKVGAGGQISIANPVGSTQVIIDVVGYYDGQWGDGYTPVDPTRILDSRPAPNQVGPFSTPWGPGQTRNVAVTGGAVPPTADAVVLNVTVTGTTAAGFLTIWPTAQPKPTASSLNWAAGDTIPNAVTVKVGAGGSIAVFNEAGNANVIIDIVGSFSAGTGSLFHPVTPARILDSRPAPNQVGTFSTPWGPTTTRDVQVTGNGGIPPMASAALLNVTVTSATASSFLTIWPAGQPAPTASSLNWVAGQTIPNAVTTKLADSGAISIRNAAGTVDVIADAAGWYG